MNIEALISKAAQEAVKALYGMDATEKMVQLQKTRSEFEGNLTLVVFPFVKAAKKSPEQTAQEIGEYLQQNCAAVEKFNVVKGFLNLSVGDGAIPKAVFMLFSVTGLACSRLFHRKKDSKRRKNYGNLIGLICVPVIWYIVLYGSFIGFNKLEVNRQTFFSADLPEAFDGYKVVVFSDAHVGSYTERNQYVLQRAIDSINAQHPDMIVYAGDLQNTQPPDLYRHIDVLSALRAKDGIYSVLGNHDYGDYICGNTARKVSKSSLVLFTS